MKGKVDGARKSERREEKEIEREMTGSAKVVLRVGGMLRKAGEESALSLSATTHIFRTTSASSGVQKRTKGETYMCTV
jgi:hypothetical protein